MRLRVFLPSCLALLVPAFALHAQEAPPPVIHFSDGGASPRGGGPMESIFIPPMREAPFSLTLATEWSRPMENGGTFTLANQRRIVRDSRGRIYQERWILVPKGGDVKSTMNVFQITDPVEHTWLNCSTRSHICELLPYRLTLQTKYLPFGGEIGPLNKGNVLTRSLAGGRGIMQVGDLGLETIQGMETHGYRSTITYNPGTMGNDRPLVVTREFWFSPQLGIDLSSLVDNPQSGKQIFSVKELSTSEPDPKLFDVPDGYRIVDHRANANQPNIVPDQP